MRFLGMANLGNGLRAKVLTREEYLVRGNKAREYRATFEASKRDGKPAHGSISKLKEDLYKTRNVDDISVLTALPYFNIAWHTLLDMMHINANVVKQAINLVDHEGTHNKEYAGETGVTELEKPSLPNIGRKSATAAAKASKNFRIAHSKWAEDVAKCAANKRLADFRLRFRSTAQESAALEAAYGMIQAPINIAPRSKRPIEVPGQMTAHQWVNFAKVYGKYLFLQMYSRPEDTVDGRNLPLEAICALLSLLTSCLASDATAELKVETARQVTELATRFDEYFPESELTVMMHVLVHHVPNMILVWGPTRGYWCFPFER
jgi:hypothetical protein